MNKRAAIYARVSTDLQRGNYSIPTQISEVKKYADKQGYTIVGDLYVDLETGRDTIRGNGAIPAYVDDYSSRELSRPGLDAALRYLDTTGFDILVVHSLDRLARDPYIRQTLEREFMARDARVEFVLGNYEETPEGEVRKDLDATFAKWENAKRVERCNRGKRRKAESGLVVTGKAPYGYKWDKNAPAGLAVNEEQAAIVQWVFDAYVNEGFSIQRINAKLEKKGVPTHSGSQKWGSTSINRILKNTIYIGHTYYNRQKLLSGNKRQIRERSEWIEIRTTPIVEKWLFDEAQKRFAENRERKRSQPNRFYLLTGMVVCKECKKPYITQTYPLGKQRRVTEKQIYRHRMDHGHCSNHSTRADVLEPVVWDKVVQLLQDPERLREGYETSLEQQKEAYSRQQAHMETLKKKAMKLEQSKQNLNTAYIDPEIGMTKTEYLEQKAKIDDELKIINEEIDINSIPLIDLPSLAELKTLETFAAQICRKLDLVDPPPQEKRKLFELLHLNAVISLDGTVDIEGWFAPQEDDGLLNRQSP